MRHILYEIYKFYYEGFAQMRLGRILWAVIAIKLFIIFVILKFFFFPDFISQKAQKGAEAEYVSGQLTNR